MAIEGNKSFVDQLPAWRSVCLCFFVRGNKRAQLPPGRFRGTPGGASEGTHGIGSQARSVVQGFVDGYDHGLSESAGGVVHRDGFGPSSGLSAAAGESQSRRRPTCAPSSLAAMWP